MFMRFEKNVAIISLGCPKNLVDSEIMINKIKKADYEIVSDIKSAQYIIINTCTFIEDATSESISKILEISELKNKKDIKIIAAGCMAQRYKEKIIKHLPQVDYVVGTGNIDNIVKVLGSTDKKIYVDNINSDSCFDLDRHYSTPRSYTYLKIAEGCNKKCTYCIIPSLRGKYRSRDFIEIISETKELIKVGYKEIVLIAEDITSYGKGKKDYIDLSGLLEKINDVEGDFNIRLLYCYPEDIIERLIGTIKKSDKVIKYIDMPIQHISDDILKKMNRKTNSKYIKETIKDLRNQIPEIAIRTSLIVGTPGEREEDFEQLCDFVSEFKLDNVGVFSYSREEGTPAYSMKDQVSEALKESRRDELMTIQRSIIDDKNNKTIGKIFDVVIDGISDDGLFYKGRIYSQAPEIDNETFVLGLKDLKIGDKVSVRIIAVDEYDLIGEITYESSE